MQHVNNHYYSDPSGASASPLSLLYSRTRFSICFSVAFPNFSMHSSDILWQIYYSYCEAHCSAKSPTRETKSSSDYLQRTILHFCFTTPHTNSIGFNVDDETGSFRIIAPNSSNLSQTFLECALWLSITIILSLNEI